MGQYYRVALVDEYKPNKDSFHLKVVKPDGYKLLEHGYYGTRTMDRVEKILEDDWYHVMWIGDYAECASLVWTHETEDTEALGYNSDNDNPEDFIQRKEMFDYYLVNKYKHEYINMSEQEADPELKDNFGFVIHPLAILCRASGDFGGGDYYGDQLNIDRMGAWCGDVIKVIKRQHGLPFDIDGSLKGFHDCTDIYRFKEN